MIIVEKKKKTHTVYCPVCGEDRESTDHAGLKVRRCKKCYIKQHNGRGLNGENHWNWKGGKHIRGDGYVEVYLQPDDFFFPMAGSNHYVKEHRLVVAKSIGRCLHSWEQVHHINGDIKDNQLENLLLRDSNSHDKKYGSAYTEGFSDGYKKGYADAKKEMRKLSSVR